MSRGAEWSSGPAGRNSKNYDNYLPMQLNTGSEFADSGYNLTEQLSKLQTFLNDKGNNYKETVT